MKKFRCHQRKRGLTRVELLVVMAVLVCLAIFFVEVPDRNYKERAMRVQCLNNLKQTGLAFRIWAGDHGDKYPMELSETNGGTMEFTSGPNAFRHFLVMSNEIETPKVLFCPAETKRARVKATTFSSAPKPGEVPFTSNSNLSYFVGIDATEINLQSILSGDHNIIDGTPIKNGILELNTNSLASFTAEMHNRVGTIALADGSIQQMTGSGLRNALVESQDFTNRLQMPVLTP